MIGIMQGRLSPPEGDRIQSFPYLTWRNELSVLRRSWLEFMEWIFDADDFVNPLMGPAPYNIFSEVRAVCADYFMARPFVRAFPGELKERSDVLRQLICACGGRGIKRIILPLVDDSAMKNKRDKDRVVGVISNTIPSLETYQVELHLETSLAPDDFRQLLDRVDHRLVKANYDTGNSASLAYDPREEFAAYGDRIGSVHIKDRVRGGGTVPLGSGDADFPAVFSLLEEHGYQGDYTLQTARGEPGNEWTLADENVNFILRHMEA